MAQPVAARMTLSRLTNPRNTKLQYKNERRDARWLVSASPGTAEVMSTVEQIDVARRSSRCARQTSKSWP